MSSVLLCSRILSIIVLVIGALNRVKMKCLLVYSGVGHMGSVFWGSFESVEAGFKF